MEVMDEIENADEDGSPSSEDEEAEQSGSGEAEEEGEQGACSSDADCPASDPVCSEFGFCQCESYQPGDDECWQGSKNKGKAETGADDQETGEEGDGNKE